jgi:hypothetical protein
MAGGVTTDVKHTKRNGGVDGVNQRTKTSALKVGLLSGLGEHPNSDEGMTVPEVGAIQEFGAGVPERPFIRQTIAQNITKYNRMRRDLLSAIIRGKITVDKAIAVLGEAVQADIVAAINGWSDPPNSEATQAEKGANNPLVDTGTMKQSIHWEKL